MKKEIKFEPETQKMFRFDKHYYYEKGSIYWTGNYAALSRNLPIADYHNGDINFNPYGFSKPDFLRERFMDFRKNLLEQRNKKYAEFIKYVYDILGLEDEK